MSIVTKCMVLSLRIGFWEGQRFDKATTQDLNRRAQAEEGASRVNLHLVAPAALKSVTTARNAVRTHFYADTLPWRDNGDRIITRAAYLPFIERHEELAAAYRAEAHKFCKEVYPEQVRNAQKRMGALFKLDDYPSPREVYRRFTVSLDIDPVSQASDFRVDMDADELARMRTQIENNHNDRVRAAMSHVWTQLTDVVGRFADRTAADGIIRVEVTRSLQELVAKLPAMNIIDDPQLEEIRQQLEQRLTGYEVTDLRANNTVRAQAAAEAQAIMERMRGMMTAMQGMGA